jgi:hypothetical protein
VRRWAALRACLDKALRDVDERPSRRNARVVARDRVRDGRRRDLLLVPPFRADAVPFGGGDNFTPARLAFESPIAIACLALRAPCLPSRTW